MLKLLPVDGLEIKSGAAQNLLLNAMIAELPSIGTEFPAPARRRWLDMMAMAFDVAYGMEGAPLIEATPAAAAVPAKAPPAPQRDPHVAAGHDYYVDHQGFVRCDVQKNEIGVPVTSMARRVLAEEIDADEVIYDYRGTKRDRSTVIWADDTVGAKPGMAFGGPG